MKVFSPASIKGLVTLIVGLALLPSLCLLVYSSFAAARAELQIAEQSAARIGSNVARLQAARVENTHKLLLALADLREVRERNLRALGPLFEKIRLLSGLYADIRLCASDGRVLASSLPSPKALSGAELEHIRLASATGFAVRELAVGTAFDKLVFSCVLPVSGKSPPDSVLVASLFMEPPGHHVDGFIPGKGRSLFVMDGEGRILSSYPPESSEEADTAASVAKAWSVMNALPAASGLFRQDTDMAIAFEKLFTAQGHNLNMSVLVSLSGKKILESKQRRIWLDVSLLVAATLLALFIARRLSYTTLHVPVVNILAVAGMLKEGDLLARVKNLPMARELRELAVSLNLMAEALLSRNAELVAARDTANAVNQAKTDFLATMSHEIRTPMNAIIGMAYLARQSVLTVQQRSYLDAIQSEAEKLLLIINDILNFSKIEAGRFPVERVSFALGSILDDMIRRVHAEAEKKSLSFVATFADDLPAYLKGDPMLLSQVLGNIIVNAIKFTPNGEVRLHCSVERPEPPGLVLVCDVRDTAGGMNSLEKEMLFPDAEPEGKISTFDAGVGLNLSITRRLTRLMGGALSVKTNPGTGSTVTIRLPFEESAPLSASHDSPAEAAGHDAVSVSGREPSASTEIAAPSAESGVAPAAPNLPDFAEDKNASRGAPPNHDSLQGVRILLVEDNPINQQLAAELLKGAGAQVHTASNGQEALNMLEAMSKGYPYNLVLMDLQMPVLDGLAATRRIRLDERFRQLPIIAMTAHDPRDEWPKCREVGMNDYIAKPLDVPVFLSVVSRWLPQGEESGGKP